MDDWGSDFNYVPDSLRQRRREAEKAHKANSLAQIVNDIRDGHLSPNQVQQMSNIILANSPVPITKERPYIVAPLDEIQNGKITIPQKFFQNEEEAARHAAHLTRQDRPMYVLKIVSKVEMAPPPVVTTSFE